MGTLIGKFICNYQKEIYAHLKIEIMMHLLGRLSIRQILVCSVGYVGPLRSFCSISTRKSLIHRLTIPTFGNIKLPSIVMTY